MTIFALNPRPTASLSLVGDEREPVLQIDGLLLEPQLLADYAAMHGGFVPAWGPAGGYPGIRAPAPFDYVRAVAHGIDPILRDAFGLRSVKLAQADCNFSLVTLGPDQLAPSQRVPHADSSYPLQFAFLHYLCGAELGGTGFYRHRATGYEAMTPERVERYDAIRAGEGEPGQGYIDGDTPHFARTGAVDAAWNRLTIYRSHVLHSGLIPQGAALSADPRAGRLTANIFVSYRPA